jgi:HEAT repeat protein
MQVLTQFFLSLTAVSACAHAQDARLELRCPAPSAQFRVGEVIPLDLVFTATTPKRYQVNMASYHRGGRMSYEAFEVVPRQGTRDPLAVYFASSGGILGGLTTHRFLSDAPETIHLDLNEWVSIDRPGIYRVSVTSRRVADVRAGQEPLGKELELKSNQIVLEILPADPEWQRAKLLEIRARLNGKPSPGFTANDPRQEAIKALRYLGSEEAAREMARGLRGEDPQADHHFGFGLVGSPHRREGLAEMQALLRNPDFPVSGQFVFTMSLLDLDPDQPAEDLRTQRQEALDRIHKALAESLSSKRGRARGVSLSTAIWGLDQAAPAETRRKMAEQLMQYFDDLPIQTRIAYLKYEWDLVKGPQMLPLLRRVAQQFEDFPEPRAAAAYRPAELAGEALTRWYELDPAGARSAVIAEIQRPKPRLDARILGILADKELPEVEQALADRLAGDTDFDIQANAASLLARYGTRAVLPQVLAALEDRVGAWACVPQNAALAFVLKVDPPSARPLLERALDARGSHSNACRRSLLVEVASMHYDPLLEELAIRRLSDPDPEVALDAANLLGKYGSAEAEPPLWRRYEAWSREWSGRAAELRHVFGEQNPNEWHANLGQSLAQALATGQGWLADQAKLQRILALSVTPGMKQQMEQCLDAWSHHTRQIIFSPGNPPSFDLAQYRSLSLDALKAKLAQFPEGTAFYWTPVEPSVSQAQQKALDDVSRHAAQHKLTIVRRPD